MTRPTTTTRPWDAAALLETDEDVAAYLTSKKTTLRCSSRRSVTSPVRRV